MKTIPKIRSYRLVGLSSVVIGLCAGLFSSVLAQQEEPTDFFELSPFEVVGSRDVGYVAASSLAGGRTETDLRETPSAISVLTRQFLDDLGATGMREMSEWTVNTTPNYNTSNTVTNQSYELNIRGLGASFPSRNYFVWYVNSDAYATERLEFARGPNGVLFGDGGIGGLVTTYSKNAYTSQERFSAAARIDTQNAYRTTLDYNKPLSENAAIRVNLLVEEGRDFRDRIYYPRQGVQASSLYRLGDRTTIRLEGEWGSYSRTAAPMNYWDYSSYWTDPSNIYEGPGTDQPATGEQTGVGRMSSNIYSPALPQLGLADWSMFSRSLGTGMAILPDAPREDIPNAPTIPSRKFNMNAPDQKNRYDYWTYTASVEHRVTNDFYIQLAYNRLRNKSSDFGSRENFYQLFLDLNTVLPNGEPNPKFMVPFSEVRLITNNQGNVVDDLRLMATYRFERNWISQRFSTIIGVRDDSYSSVNQELVRMNGENPNVRHASNMYRVRLYADEPGQYNITEIPDIPGWELGYVPTGGYREQKKLEYFQLASTSRLLNDRLTVHAGARRDHLDRQNMSVIGTDPTGFPIWGAAVLTEDGTTVVNTPEAWGETDVWVTSVNAGAVYFFLPWLGAYANYSETFAPPTSGPNLLNGQAPGFSRSEGQDFGLKVDLADGKLSAVVNYYSSTENDRIGGNNNQVTQLRRLWMNSGRPDLNQLQYRDTYDLDAKGWEVEITGNPTRNIRLTFNMAFPETSAINLQPGLRAYYEENLPIWQAALAEYQANPGGLNSVRAQQMIQDMNSVESAIDALAPGVPTNHTPDYTANFYGTYRFTDSFLDGVEVGFGANFRGRAKIASAMDNPYDYFYSQDYSIFSGHVSYRRKIGMFDTRFQVNVYNIFDNDKYIFMTYSDYTPPGATEAVRVPHLYRYLPPRKITLTAVFSF